MGKYYTLIILWLALAVMIPPLAIGAEGNNQSDESDVIELDEIIISATRTPASLDDISASSSIVSENHIRSSTATDLGHLLEATNIVEISDYGPGSLSTASIRGSSSEQVLVLVDGERINDSRSGGVDLNNVPIDYAKRIEVVRGGQSAIYGADAVGGIINVITKQPAGTAARAWSTLGAYNFMSWGVEASKQVKTVSGILSFSRTEAEADFPFEDKYGRELVRENADFTKRSIFGRLRWDISDFTTLRLSGDHYYSDKGDPGFIGLYSPDAAKRDKANGLKVDLERKLFYRGEGVSGTKANSVGSLKLSVYKRDSALRYINPQQPYPIDDTHKTDAVGTELQMHLLQNEFPFNHFAKGGIKGELVWGISFRNDDITSTALGERGRVTHSGYIQQELSKRLDGNSLRLSRLSIFPAIRWDRYSDFEAGASPKLGFLASFGQHRITTIKANIGHSYRAPTMNDLYWPSDAYATGNPNLRPERSRDADAGIHLHLSEPSAMPELSEIRCGVSYFWSSSRDRIQWNPGASGKWSPQNLSEARSAGMEAEMQVQASPWNVPDLLNLRANYIFLKAEDALKRQLVYRPRHSLGYTLRCAGGIGIRSYRLWVQIQGLYRSRRYYTVENTKWLEPFMKHDLQLGMGRRLWNTANVDIILEVRNILDTRYQLVADYPLPGREWSIKTSIGMEGE